MKYTCILKKRYGLAVCFLVGQLFLSAQSANKLAGPELAFVTRTVEGDFQKGLKYALRDLGTLLDLEDARPALVDLLKKYTLFTPEELAIGPNLDRQAMLDFYDRRKNDILFSEVLGAFYITTIEERPLNWDIAPLKVQKGKDPATQLWLFSKDFYRALDNGDQRGLMQAVQKIGSLKNKEANSFLLKMLAEDRLFKSKLRSPSAVAEVICGELANPPSSETLRQFLRLIDLGIIGPERLSILMTELTNVYVPLGEDNRAYIATYQNLLDSLGSIEAIREAGYREAFDFEKNFFFEPVDFYGKALIYSDSLPWIRVNALHDLVQTHHPRSLYYLAAMMFRQHRFSQSTEDAQTYLSLLENLTGVQVFVEGETGMNARHDWLNDQRATLHYFQYWATKHTDYYWDEAHGRYDNQADFTKEMDSYEQLFRRLNSRNDTIALQSYLALMRADPADVAVLTQEYQELLGEINPLLPPLKYGFLEQLSALSAFCRQNRLPFDAPPRVGALLSKISATTSEQERYRLENQLIAVTDTLSITAIEAWACLRSNFQEDALSAGRTVRRFYGKHWDEIAASPVQLRLYLKKAWLFSRLGTEGVCKMYFDKFDTLPPLLEERMNDLLAFETDGEVLQSIRFIFDKKENNGPASLSNFLLAPANFTEEMTQQLPELPLDLLPLFFEKATAAATSASEKLHLWRYFDQHPNVNYVPLLLPLLDSAAFSEQTFLLLEKIYHQPALSIKQWKEKWQTDNWNYRLWDPLLFEEKSTYLEEAEVLDIDDLNSVARSPYFEQKHRKTCLQALRKLDPPGHILSLDLQPRLSVEEVVSFVNTHKMSHRDLAHLSQLADIQNNTRKYLDWLLAQAAVYPPLEQGAFYNELFRQSWFLDLCLNGALSPSENAAIQNAIQAFLQESGYLSEFEETSASRNLVFLDMAGKLLEAQILASIRLDASPEVQAAVQEILLSRLRFEDLGTVAPYLSQMAAVEGYNFLQKDFGLPVFDLQSSSFQRQLLDNQQKMTRPDFYDHYLRSFGVDFLDKDGKLDFHKISDILRYDTAIPFANEKSWTRDWFTYGIIKLLEIHFGTTLGFSEKLNEGQVFSTFSSAERAAAWGRFLEEKGLSDK